MLIPLKDFDFTRYPMICAHRGDTSLGAPENSGAAVRAAVTSGAEMVEVDVQFTTSGDIVCHHDEIEYGGVYERFDQILNAAESKLYFNIEVKGYGTIDEIPFLPSLIAMVESHSMTDYVLYSSFHPEYIAALSGRVLTTIIHPTAEMSAYLGRSGIEHMLPSELVRTTGASAYACELGELDDRRIDDICANSIHLSVYTINTPSDYERAIVCGAKGIVTDVPRALVKIRSEGRG